MYYDDIKLFFTEEKRDIFDCSYWYLSAENAIYWCLEHPNCQIFPGELVCHPVNATQIFTYCFHICGKYALRMAFSCKVGVPNFPLRPPTWGGGGGVVSQQEGQLRIFFRIFQNQRVSSSK